MAELVTHNEAWRCLFQHDIASPESTYARTATSRHHKKEERVVRNWKLEKLRRQICDHGGIQEPSEHAGNTALPPCIHQGKHRRSVCRGMIQDATGTFPVAESYRSPTRILQKEKKGAQTTELCTFPWCINTARLDGTSHVSLLVTIHN